MPLTTRRRRQLRPSDRLVRRRAVELLAAVDHPEEFTSYVHDSYSALRQQQIRLIGNG
jgi:hypothetical protein